MFLAAKSGSVPCFGLFVRRRNHGQARSADWGATSFYFTNREVSDVNSATEMKSINGTGFYGSRYRNCIYLLGTTFKAVPGNVVFAKETLPGEHDPTYIVEGHHNG